MLKKGGIYMITGGLGQMGLQLAGYLVRGAKAKLVLTSRASLPPRGEWPGALTAEQLKRVKRVMELEKEGAEIIVVTADAADEEAMREAVKIAETELGRINGVFHAAGRMKGNMVPLQELTAESCEAQFKTKIHGTLTLDKVFEGKDLDFCLLISSLSTVLGGLGLGAYAAANGFMDAFVSAVKKTGDVPWMCIDWDAWNLSETGHMGATDLAMTPAEGIEAFDGLLNRGPLSEVIVSTGDLQARVRKWLRLEEGEGEDEGEGESASLYSRPDLSVSYAAPRSALEKKLAEMWQEFFGIEGVGIHDNFFELGGDSLKGMTLVNKYKELLGEMVYVQAVFEAPTIAELATFFSRHYGEAVARVTGEKTETGAAEPVRAGKIDAARIAGIRELIPGLRRRRKAIGKKNRQAAFILSSTRSGSTLLRVLVGGIRGCLHRRNWICFRRIRWMRF